VDADGKVFGVIYLKVGLDSGINMAVPAWKARALVDKMKAGELSPVAREAERVRTRAQRSWGHATRQARVSKVDLEWQRLPDDFVACDPAGLWDAVSEAVPEKDEFETDAQYKRRLQADMSGFTYGNVATGDSVALMLDPKYESDISTSSFEARYTYDPDSQSFVIAPWARGTGLLQGHASYCAPLKTELVSRRTYEASNAFGATVEVTETTARELGLQFNNVPEARTLQLPMAPDIARAARPHIRFVYVCRLSYPYRVLDLSRLEPKITHPYDVTIIYTHLACDLLAFWVVRMDTREILLRASPGTDDRLLMQTKLTREEEARKAIRKALMRAKNFELNGMPERAREELQKVIQAYSDAAGIDQAKSRLRELESKSSE